MRNELEVEMVTLKLAGREYVVVLRERYERLARLAELPPIPSRDAKGNFAAVDYARASIAREIVQARLKAGMTQRELARRAGVRVETLCRIEIGKHTPSTRSIARIDLALKAAAPVQRRVRKRA
ncbi:MAG: multiprotein-bridging factor 1 family protein [Planctomycetota bacterium]